MALPIKFDTAANAEITVSNTVINLFTYFKGLAENTEVLYKADVWTIYVENKSIRVFENGNTPTTSLGVLVNEGQFYQISNITADKINIIRNGSADATITVIPGTSVSGVPESVKVGSLSAQISEITVDSDIDKLNGVTLVADNAAAPATDYPLPIGGEYNASAPTYSDGDRVGAQFDVFGNLKVTSGSTAIQAFGTDAIGADAYATVLTSGAAATHIDITNEGAFPAIISVDGGTTDGIYVAGNSTKTLDGVTIAAATAIQAKNGTAGSNYTGLTITIW